MREKKRVRRDRGGGKAAIAERAGLPVIHLGSANIWDGGDLTRIREAAGRIFETGVDRLGLDLAHVGVLPAGFLQMLCSWQERGAEVYLFEPRPNVREMLWFRRFAEQVDEGTWQMTCVSSHEVPATHRIDPADEAGRHAERRFGANVR